MLTKPLGCLRIQSNWACMMYMLQLEECSEFELYKEYLLYKEQYRNRSRIRLFMCLYNTIELLLLSLSSLTNISKAGSYHANNQVRVQKIAMTDVHQYIGICAVVICTLFVLPIKAPIVFPPLIHQIITNVLTMLINFMVLKEFRNKKL